MKASVSSDRGSYSVEGALSLTVFTACLMALISILTIIKTEAEVGDALRETAMELSQYSYVWGRTEYLKDYAGEKLPKLAELMGDPEGTSDLSLTGPAERTTAREWAMRVVRRMMTGMPRLSE